MVGQYEALEPVEREPDVPAGQSLAPAILLATAAVVAAVFFGRASILSESASDQWQQALRQELKRSAALTEDVRFVYADEAPLAFTGAISRVRAEELRTRADQVGEPTRTQLLTEARASELLFETYAGGSEILSDEKYGRDDGSYDLGLRLADVRQENPDLVAIYPDEHQTRGDRLSREATSMIGLGTLAPVAFLLGSLAQVFRRRRTPLLIAGWTVLGAVTVAGALLEVAG